MDCEPPPPPLEANGTEPGSSDGEMVSGRETCGVFGVVCGASVTSAAPDGRHAARRGA